MRDYKRIVKELEKEPFYSKDSHSNVRKVPFKKMIKEIENKFKE